MNLLRLLGLGKTRPNKRPTNLAFEYGTHLPVLRSIVQVFQPQGVLELGAGRFSTPLFHQEIEKVVTVETDAKWIQEVAEVVPPRNHCSLIHHRLPHLTSRTRRDSVPDQTKQECVKYYQEIIRRNPGLDLLFIDHVSGLRAHTLCSLYDLFDFVVYHDAEDKGYAYDQFLNQDNGNFFHFVLKAYVPHTGILIRKKFAAQLAEFKQVLEKNALTYFIEQYQFDLQDLTKICIPVLA